MSNFDKIIKVDDLSFGVSFEADCDIPPPWGNAEGHAIIRARANHHFRHTGKKPGEKLIHASRNTSYFVDIKATKEKAMKEAWGIGENEIAKLTKKLGRKPTRKEEVAQAIQLEVDYHSAWFSDNWRDVVIVQAIDDDGNAVDGVNNSLWGVETWRNYHEEIAHELAGTLAKNMQRESSEKQYWAERDVLTEAA